MYLKQHRKGTLELDGRKLKMHLEVSLTNQSDRQTTAEFITEIRKQLREFDPAKKKKKVGAKKRTKKKAARRR